MTSGLNTLATSEMGPTKFNLQFWMWQDGKFGYDSQSFTNVKQVFIFKTSHNFLEKVINGGHLKKGTLFLFFLVFCFCFCFVLFCFVLFCFCFCFCLFVFLFTLALLLCTSNKNVEAEQARSQLWMTRVLISMTRLMTVGRPLTGDESIKWL